MSSATVIGAIASSINNSVIITGNVFYVDNTLGNDSNDGTTINTAWKTISKVNSVFASLPSDAQILFKCGETFNGTLNIARSGTSTTSITIGSYGLGAKPIITGLTSVTSWTNIGTNLWESTSAVSTLSTLKMVVINGVNTPMGRFPAPGGTSVSTPLSWHPTLGNNDWLNYESNSGVGTTQTITDNQLTGSPNWVGAELVVKKTNSVVDHGTISAHSGSTLTYSGSMPTVAGISDSNGAMSYFIQNDLRCCTYQNAWYYNPTTKKITVYSVGAPTNVQVATIDNLINRNAAPATDNNAYITIQNLELKGSNDDAIFLKSNVSGNTIGWKVNNCDFKFIGRDGVYCYDSVQNFEFSNNTLSDVNNNGVYVGPNSSNIIMINNVLNNIGINIGMTDQNKDKGSVSAEGLHAHCTLAPYTSTITNNRIINVGYNGISFYGSNSLINKNFIQNFNVTKSDGGAIYSINENLSIRNSNRIIEDNIIVNGSLLSTIGTYNETTKPAVNGIHLENGVDNVIIRRNSIYNVNSAGIYLNTPIDVQVSYNTIYDCRFSSIYVNKDSSILSSYGYSTLNYNQFNNLLIAKTLNQPQGNNFAFTMSQRCFYYISNANDISTNVTSNNNTYSRPLDETSANPISRVVYTGIGSDGTPITETKYTLSAWKTAYPTLDSASIKGPYQVTDSSWFKFEYNDTSLNKTVDLGSVIYKDTSGVSYSNSLVLAPYTSKLLLQIGPVYYVDDINGNDSNSGLSTSLSWQTLNKVNTVMSSLPAASSILFKKGGTWSGTITMNKSGTTGLPIVIGAYGTGTKPKITGFNSVSAWTSIGTNLWQSTNAVSTLSTCNVLTINNVYYPKARLPKTGYWTIPSTNGSTTITDTTNLNSSVITAGIGAEVVVRELMYEVNNHTITNFTGNTITFGAGAIPSGWGYFIQNDSKHCTQLNDWAYNTSTKKITLYSTASPVNVKVSTVDIGINTNGKQYLLFDNLDISGFNSTGIFIGTDTIPNEITVNNCDITFIGINGIDGYGNPAVNPHGNAPKLKVTNCNLSDIGSRGIWGASASNAIISYNNLSRIGHFAGMGSNGDDSYTGIIANGDNSVVSYNNITDIGYCGIRWDGNSTVITNNFVKNTTYIKDDGGAIYCYPVQFGNTPHTQATRTVSNNVIVNALSAPAGSIYGNQGCGIYMDGQSPNINVTNNFIINEDSNTKGFLGIFVNGGHDINCNGNTTYNWTVGYYLIEIGGANTIYNETLNNNIFVAKVTDPSCGLGQYAAEFLPSTGSMPTSFVASNNVYARPIDETRGWIYKNFGTNCNTLTQWKATVTGKEVGSTSSPFIITNLNKIRYEYNGTNVSIDISLNGNTYKDMKNVTKTGIITLAPYSGIILLNTA